MEDVNTEFLILMFNEDLSEVLLGYDGRGMYDGIRGSTGPGGRTPWQEAARAAEEMTGLRLAGTKGGFRSLSWLTTSSYPADTALWVGWAVINRRKKARKHEKR